MDLFSFLDYLLLVYRNTVCFCVLILLNLLALVIVLWIFVIFLYIGLCYLQIKVVLLTPLQIGYFLSFSLAKTYITVFQRSGESGNLCLAPDLS